MKVRHQTHIYITYLLAYRCDTNLKQLLVQSSLNPKPNGTHPCGHSLCRTCEHTNQSFLCHIWSQEHFPYSTSLYLLICLCYLLHYLYQCSISYIGETCCQLNTRFGERLRSAEEKKHLSSDY